jgi:hypothetical protein
MVAQVGHAKYAAPPPDYVDGDMTPAQIASVLADLRFPSRNAKRSIEIDHDVARYLIGILQRPK